MSLEKDSILKLIVGFALIVLTLAVVKKYMLPLIDELSINSILNLPMLDLLKIFESILIIILLAGFVLQELLHAVSSILQKHEDSSASRSRWADLWYAFVGIFGSAGLYIAVSNISLKGPL